MEKLIRDKIPEIIRVKGEQAIIRKASSDEEYATYLKNKLFEEIDELYSAENPQHMAEEMADVMEVLRAVINFYKLSETEIEQIRRKKLDKRGGFLERIIWSDGNNNA